MKARPWLARAHPAPGGIGVRDESCVRVGGFLGNGLDYTPVLDDLAVFESQDVDDGDAPSCLNCRAMSSIVLSLDCREVRMRLPTFSISSRSVLLIVLSVAGCAGLAKTEGTSGPVAWRAGDFAIVTRDVQGQLTETYEFKLVVKNISDRTVTFTSMQRTVYQAGGGQPGSSTASLRWELKPGAEWTYPLYSYTYCSASHGCLDRGGAQPIWRIALTGTDDQRRPIESRFEIILPARPATSVDRAITRRASPPAEAAARPATTPPPPRESATPLVVEAPVWQVGDEWEIRWQNPNGSGTFVWAVNRVETIDGTDYYVVAASEGREIYWRKRDRALYMDKLPAGIVTRNVPPMEIPWPLSVGKSWEGRFTRERPTERATTEEARACSVEKEEHITVPAGTFATLKIVCRNTRDGQMSQELWYSPDVRQWVKERTPSGAGVQDRELLRYYRR
jgi:hypothetical protein